MYLTPNFEKLTVPCYIHPQSSSALVAYFTTRDLHLAAQTELQKYSPIIDERAVYAEAEEAFKALDVYFKQAKGRDAERKPTTLLDAAVFSYTFLLLELNKEAWADGRLASLVRGCGGLVEHKEEIRKSYFRARVPSVWKKVSMEGSN
jgi:metaxin